MANTEQTVGLFVTCLIDSVRPNIGFSVVKLLEEAGFTVVVPSLQTCCGQPAYNAGDREAAHALAQKWLGEFSAFDYVVIPSGSCAGTVLNHYEDLFRDDTDLLRDWQRLRPRVYEFCTFLHEVVQPSTLPVTFQGKLTYHDSCSGLRELGIKKQPRELLGKVADLELVEMEHSEQCCGFGGAFSVKYGELSTAIADEKCDDIAKSGAQAVALGDLGCMMQIAGRLNRRGNTNIKVWHIAEVLAGEQG